MGGNKIQLLGVQRNGVSNNSVFVVDKVRGDLLVQWSRAWVCVSSERLCVCDIAGMFFFLLVPLILPSLTCSGWNESLKITFKSCTNWGCLSAATTSKVIALLSPADNVHDSAVRHRVEGVMEAVRWGVLLGCTSVRREADLLDLWAGREG